MPKTILLLEDEKILRKIYEKKLKSEGINIFTCATTKECTEALKQNTIDIAFIDHGLSNEEITGIEYLPIIKEISAKTDIYILSNFNDFQLKQSAIDNGAKDFLIKLNYGPKQLISFINKL